MNSDLPRVSVIVPVYNAEKDLPLLIDSLKEQTYPRGLVEWVFVDNNSADGSWAIIQSESEAIALQQAEWPGPAETRNLGIAHATGEVFAFVDADCVTKPQWLMNGVRTLVDEKLDRVAGYVEFICSDDPGLCEIYDFTTNFQQDEFVNNGWSGSGNLFTRREIFDDIGGFNRGLYSHEDAEWGLRATKAGYSLGYSSDAAVSHPSRKTLKALILKWIRTEFGAAQAYRQCGLAELHLWKKKANWRPLFRQWKRFPEEYCRTWRQRVGITLLANVLRLAGNLGNFLGYYNICKWVLKG
jgi:glycosyltransferase AglE